MIELQETRSTSGIGSVILELAYDRTWGDSYGAFLPIEESEILTSAWRATYDTDSSQIAEDARQLLSVIQERMLFLHRVGYSFSDIPPLRAFHVEDGSLLFEWVFDDLRVGFTLEPQAADSGWYLISRSEPIQMSAHGHLSSVNLRTLVQWILEVILYST